MENKTLRKIKILTGIILVLFLIPTGIEAVKNLVQGWQAAGYEEKLSVEEGIGYQTFFVELEPSLSREAFRPVGNGNLFSTFSEQGQLIVPVKVWWIVLLESLLAIASLVLFVLFIVLLLRLFSKITKRRVMGEENTDSLRIMAYVLGGSALSAYLMEITEFLWLRSQVSLEGYKIILHSPPVSLIIALILLAAAEILKLGNRLQQEQDLTV